jgi:hypothetical protein
LCNFACRIVEEVVRDDGAEQSHLFAIEGVHADSRPLPRVEVVAEQFAALNWPVAAWGVRAVVYAGQGTKDHLRVAVQVLSGDPPRRSVYTHTGWREINGAWHYLHAGGAIGPNGEVGGVEVALPNPLALYQLPMPPAGDELKRAVRASLDLAGLGPDRLTLPGLAAVYRAALGFADFGVFLVGATQVFKSEFAALLQQHYGAGMVRTKLPANWASTGNALERLQFHAKDALLVVDDFCPAGSGHDVQRFHKEADRVFRGQGNAAGRGRMRSDGSLASPRPPRGLTLATGEDLPRGQSLRSRLLVLEVGQGDLDAGRLSACQEDAAAGLYAAVMAGYVRWLALRYGDRHRRLPQEVMELRREAAGVTDFARTPAIVAELGAGWRHFLDFAAAVGAVTPAERDELWRRGWAAFRRSGAAQAQHIAACEPAEAFLRLLGAALAGGLAHVADPDGKAPEQPECWGWRPDEFAAGGGDTTRLTPQGTRVGWLCDGELYLNPDNSFAAVQRLAQQQNESFAITAQTLRKRLKEKGKLAATDEKRSVLTVRKSLQGARRDVLHLVPGAHPSLPETRPTRPGAENHAKKGVISRSGPPGDPTAEPDQPDTGPDHDREPWSGDWSGSPDANGQPDHGPGCGDREIDGSGRVGQVSSGGGVADAEVWQEGVV